MPHRQIVTCLTLMLVLVSQAVLAATFNTDDKFSIIYHNGKKVENGFFSNSTEVELSPGSQNIILVYLEVFEGAISDDHQIVESEPFAINFNAQEGQSYQLQYNKIIDVDAAKQFIANPEVRVLNSKGETVASTLVYQPRIDPQQEALRALMPQSNSTNVTQTQSAAASAIQPQTPSQANLPTPVESRPDSPIPEPAVTPPPTPLDMLEFWWSKATKKERQLFLKRVDSH